MFQHLSFLKKYHVSLVHPELSGQKLKKRRLSRAVSSHNAHKSSGFQRKAHRLQLKIFVFFRNSFDFQYFFAHIGSFPSRAFVRV